MATIIKFIDHADFSERKQQIGNDIVYTFIVGEWQKLRGMRFEEIHIPITTLLQPEMRETMYQVILPALIYTKGKVIGYFPE